MRLLDAIDVDIRSLEKWLAEGQKGDYPVDLGSYGIRLEGDPPTLIEVPEAPESVDVKSIATEEVDRAQENLRLELEQVRQQIRDHEWREAVARARHLEGLARGDIKEVARDLIYQAQVKLNQELETLLASGDVARAENNNETAQEQYQAALELDPSNSHARLALQELHGSIRKKGLRERKDNSHGGSIGGIPPGGGSSSNKFEQSKNNFRISVSYPRLLSKRFESPFLLQIYLPEKRSQVMQNIKAEFQNQVTNEQIKSSSVKPQQKIKIKLFSPAFDFPESVTKSIDKPVNRIAFLGMPKDNCEPGFHKVLISISDVNTDQEFESLTISAKVVDFAFDHVSRPLLSRTSAVVLGIGSFAIFILTLLEQIDKTVGLTSGTASGILAAVVYTNFYNLYQRIRPNIP